MKDALIAALLPFFNENYPELLADLTDSEQMDAFLLAQLNLLEATVVNPFQDQLMPEWEVVEQSLLTLSAHHGPSRYQYLAEVLEEDFLDLYLDYQATGILHTELMGLVDRCSADFEFFSFRENEDSRLLRYAVIEQVQSYCEEGEVIAANLLNNGLQ